LESHQINNREEQTSVSLALAASHHQKIERSHTSKIQNGFLNSISSVLLQENIMLK
jgi:hypothetical protein